MADLTSAQIAVGKWLFESAAAAALVMENALPEIYARLRLGRGFLRRKMSDEVKAKTGIEVWAYVSALLVSLVETWPDRPDLRAIICVLEGALLDARRINYRPAYEAYRLRLREGRSRLGVPDPTIFGPMYALHVEFLLRLAEAWAVPSGATVSPYASIWTLWMAKRTAGAFTPTISELTRKLESGLRKRLKGL